MHASIQNMVHKAFFDLSKNETKLYNVKQERGSEG